MLHLPFVIAGKVVATGIHAIATSEAVAPRLAAAHSHVVAQAGSIHAQSTVHAANLQHAVDRSARVVVHAGINHIAKSAAAHGVVPGPLPQNFTQGASSSMSLRDELAAGLIVTKAVAGAVISEKVKASRGLPATSRCF